MSLTVSSPAYLRYLVKFQRDAININNFEHICTTIVNHTTDSINSTFERCAMRGETSTEVTIRLGSIVDSQPIVENAPPEAKQNIRDQLFFFITELLKDKYRDYTKVEIKITEDGQGIELIVDWSA